MTGSSRDEPCEVAIHRVDREDQGTLQTVRDRGDRGRSDRDTLEEVDVRAEGVGDRGLDRVGVRHRDEDGARMTLDESRQGGHDPRLHLGERLATGEAEAAWMPLNGPPLGPARDPFQRPAGPGADVELDEPALDAEGETARPGDGGRGLTRALERRGVDRRDLREI